MAKCKFSNQDDDDELSRLLETQNFSAFTFDSFRAFLREKWPFQKSIDENAIMDFSLLLCILNKTQKENILVARYNSNFHSISFDKVGGDVFDS